MDSMTDRSRGVVVGVDAHTDTHDVAVLDDCGRLLARQRSRPTPPAIARCSAWIGRVRADRGDRRGVHRQLCRRAGASPTCRGPAGARGQPAAPAHAPAARQERPDRRRTGRPPRVGRKPARGRQGHQRDRRGDPPAAGRARRRRQGAQRRAERARRPDRHRSRGSAPTADRRARPHALARRCANACAPTLAGSGSPSRQPRPRCGRSRDVSPSSTARSSCSTNSSRSSSPRPRRSPSTASRSAPGTPPRCS